MPTFLKPATRKVVLAALQARYAGLGSGLDFNNPFELLVAVVLSAQSTDKMVNVVTKPLFARYPTAVDIAALTPEEFKPWIARIGLTNNKAKNIVAASRLLVERHGGEVPGAIEDLVLLPGVGRKTANVVRSVALGLPGLPVDTHVLRLGARLGLATETDPVKVEHELGAFVRPADRGLLSLRLILHGRQVCLARSPRCAECVLADICPSAFRVGTVTAAAGSPKARTTTGRATRGAGASAGVGAQVEPAPAVSAPTPRRPRAGT